MSSMNILYVGDIMGDPGVATVEKILPDLRKELSLDVVLAQAENVTAGRGISKQDFERLKTIGIDGFSGGNWSLYRTEIVEALGNPNEPIVRPANYPSDTAGLGAKIINTKGRRVLLVSLLGQIVGKDSARPADNPLHVIDKVLEDFKTTERDATIVNFHGDFSSEKKMIGYYLDGRVTAVIGDHWHIPTADAFVLPAGTGHITDVGMCGALHSSLGVKLTSTLPRWKDGIQTRNLLETDGPMQFNALLIKVGDDGLASAVQQIQRLV